MITIYTKKVDLQKAFKVLSTAMSTNDGRYYLKGVCLYQDKDATTLVSTDGHRLVQIDVKNNSYFTKSALLENEKGSYQYIIPSAAVKDFIAPDRTKSKNVTIKIDKGTVTFEYDSASKTYDLIDGTYPEYKNAIPKKTKSLVKFQPRYVESLCKNLPAKDFITFKAGVEKGYASHGRPQIIETDNGVTYVIMSMRMEAEENVQ